ncbi:MAG: serine hydrolase domain-containing protein [Bacteroidota bacterium]
MKRLIKRVLLVLLIAVLAFATWFAWPRLPIITAFTAKGMCSSVFYAEKAPERVAAEDLSFFPISLAKSEINYEEKSVTSKVFGLAKRKAVYRDGLGSVLVLKKPENELKAAMFNIPDPGFDPDTLPWPKGNILPDQKPAGIDYDKLTAILDAAFDKPGEEPFRKSLGVAVVYDNQLIGEKYLDGYDATTPFLGWSMTKSITGAMTGILVEEGLLDLNAPAAVPEWTGDERKDITTEQILHMSSGLDWFENYFTISDATVMLMQSDDMFASVIKCPAKYKPGTYWNYSSGDANLLSGLIRTAIGNDEAYHRFPYERLLHPIGMVSTLMETDASGLFVASSYCYATTRDWARFGLLFLNNGIFEGDTILQPSWVDFCRTPAPASGGNYAGTFWLKESNPLQELKDVPSDVYFADGFQGQRIYIIPSKKLVVVRMGYSMANLNMNEFLRDIIATLPD